MIKFIIPYPKSKAQRTDWCKRYGLNAIYQGKHWTKRREDSEFWHYLVHNELHRQGIPRKTFENPVRITMFWNDNMDIDNHSYIGKMIVDALKGWLIADDTRKYFASVTHRFHDKDYVLVEIAEVIT